ncbi:RHS repeat-associated core domain-containing protein [Streptomyces sp. NPDC093516]|uniref:RHS repeat-associated core domain-containing protein n=1 Tax=Streptomyces sp. NPDC093516 TaxID=3155304 RepID=UPI003425BBB9
MRRRVRDPLADRHGSPPAPPLHRRPPRPHGPVQDGPPVLDPSLGPFTQPDPSGQEINPYSYASGDPFNHADPSGPGLLRQRLREGCRRRGVRIERSQQGGDRRRGGRWCLHDSRWADARRCRLRCRRGASWCRALRDYGTASTCGRDSKSRPQPVSRELQCQTRTIGRYPS